MRIKLFAAAAILAAMAAQAVESQPVPAAAGADLCRPRRPRARRAGRRACPGRGRRRGSTREAPECPGRAQALPDRGRCRRADSRQRRHRRPGQLSRRPAERLARPAGAARAAQRISGARAGACRIGPASCGWSRPTRSSPITAETAERLRAILREAAAAERAAANHRHRPRLPRARLAAGRERDPDLPADRRQPADLAHRPAPAGRAAALVGRARPRSSTRRPRRRARHPALVPARLHPARRGCRGDALREAGRRGGRGDPGRLPAGDRRASAPARGPGRGARPQKDDSSTPTPAQSG